MKSNSANPVPLCGSPLLTHKAILGDIAGKEPVAAGLFSCACIFSFIVWRFGYRGFFSFNAVSRQAKLCKEPADYYYSSAKFYETGFDDFGFLRHIGEAI